MKHRISFTRNVRNTLPKRTPDLVGGERVRYPSLRHPWDGLYPQLAGGRLTGDEHDVYADGWRVRWLVEHKVFFDVFCPRGDILRGDDRKSAIEKMLQEG